MYICCFKRKATVEIYRKRLESIDKKIILLLSERMEISGAIGDFKIRKNIGIEQEEYWKAASGKRKEIALKIGLPVKFVERVFALIRQQSIQVQEQKIEKIHEGK